MTSNLGSREMSSIQIGFSGEQGAYKGNPEKAIQNHFSPEFRNILDSTIIFDRLDEAVIKQIVKKQLRELELSLVSKKVDLIADDLAISWLAEHGYDAPYGARPMTRLIQEKIKDKLVDKILFGTLEHGGKVYLSAKDGELIFKYQKN
jgi:ATP-dependent Clp protease ATP-binding subunit ClpA